MKLQLLKSEGCPRPIYKPARLVSLSDDYVMVADGNTMRLVEVEPFRLNVPPVYDALVFDSADVYSAEHHGVEVDRLDERPSDLAAFAKLLLKSPRAERLDDLL